jgi:hypothetical protein
MGLALLLVGLEADQMGELREGGGGGWDRSSGEVFGGI